MKNSRAKILFGIFIIALFLRLSAVFSQEGIDELPKSDAIEYDEMAVNLASGNGLSLFINGSITPVAYRTPVYPIFLAGIYSIFGHSYLAVKIIQAVIGALFCIVIFLIANIIYDDATIGLIASLCVALYKPFISGFSYCGGPKSLLSEYLHMFMVGLAVLTTLYFIKNRGIRIGILSGIFMGLAILTRPEFVIFPSVLAIYLLYISRLSVKTFIKKYFIIYLFIILTMSPWVIRNYIVYKDFIPLTTLGGGQFWLGNNSLANGGSFGNLVLSEDRSSNQEDKKWFKVGIRELRNNPRRIPKLFIKKILVLWAPFENGFKIFNPFYAFVLFFGSIGILFFRKKVILEKVLLIILLSATIAAIIIFGHPRYRYPYEPYLIIFTALAISGIIKKMKGNIICKK